MKTKLILTIALIFILLSLNAQSFDQAKKKTYVKKEEITQKDSITELNRIRISDRTHAKPASIELWQPLPQFQVEQNYEPHWYAIENADDSTYWTGVKINRVIVCLEKGKTENDIQSLIDQFSLRATNNKSKFPEIMNFFVYEIPNPSKEKMLEIISTANDIDFIEFAEPDIIIESKTCYPNDPYYLSNQWGPYNVWADSAWCYETGSNTWEMIGIIDNACDYYQPDLYNTVWYGWDFADGDFDPTPVNTTVNHGTHVSGISSGELNNGIGISGMANDTVYFAKVTTDADPIPYDNTAIINAINYFSSEPRIRVINMSFGGTSINAAQQTACFNAWNNGKLLIAASGNSNASPVLYPAGYSSVIAVGSIDQNYDLSSFSNYGSDQELTAPGGDGVPYDAGDIYSTLPNNSYGYMAGTSMAAPLVTGLAGLMFAANPSLTNSQARTILQQCVWDFGTTGWDQYYGYGVVCAYCAVINAILFTGENNFANNTSWNIFPNPSTGQFIVQSDNTNSNASISVTNILGEEIYKIAIVQSNNSIIDLSNSSTGIYFVRINEGEKWCIKKIMKL
jgi:thermitase